MSPADSAASDKHHADTGGEPSGRIRPFSEESSSRGHVKDAGTEIGAHGSASHGSSARSSAEISRQSSVIEERNCAKDACHVDVAPIQPYERRAQAGKPDSDSNRAMKHIADSDRAKKLDSDYGKATKPDSDSTKARKTDSDSGREMSNSESDTAGGQDDDIVTKLRALLHKLDGSDTAGCREPATTLQERDEGRGSTRACNQDGTDRQDSVRTSPWYRNDATETGRRELRQSDGAGLYRGDMDADQRHGCGGGESFINTSLDDSGLLETGAVPMRAFMCPVEHVCTRIR